MRYYVEEGWTHLFPDGRERMVRFVIDTNTEELLALQLQDGGWQRVPKGSAWFAHVLGSLKDNDVFDELRPILRGESGELLHPDRITSNLPEWASWSDQILL